MDAYQYEDWADFTARMARCVRPGLRGPRRARLVAEATTLVRAVPRALDHRAIADWDAPPGPGAYVEGALARSGHAAPGGGLDEDGALALACVQAGFDVAVSPSADGVVGSEATLGLLRRMYPEGLPGFVRRHLAATGVEAEAAADGLRLWL